MSITGGTLPLTATDKTECAPHLNGGVCSNDTIFNNMKKFAKEKYMIEPSKSKTELVESLKKLLGVESEAEILQHQEFKPYTRRREVSKVLRENFKPAGPSHTTELLDNYNIDETLHQWAKHSKKSFGKNFYHIPFQMIDFDRVGSELSRISIPKLICTNIDCFGVVLNTDVSSGGGKHWFCIFGDLKHSGSENDPYVIEFFNSSGNPPVREVNLWMEKVCADVMKSLKKHCVTHRSTQKLQTSKTECGMWALTYIKCRLEGNGPDYLFKIGAKDSDMVGLRKFRFRRVQ